VGREEAVIREYIRNQEKEDQRGIERLEQNGIVQQASDAKRDRVYCAQALLDILEEPARLKPFHAENG
jgi:hypothetical protein